MRDVSQGKFRQQITFLRRQFLQEGDLPFRDVLSEALVQETLTKVGVVWNDAIYTPLVTLWVFLSQVLSADHSCRSAVARLIAHRISRGQRACSPETSAYCQARKRLPEKSSPKSPVELVVSSTARRLAIGCGKGARFICSMERPFPCRTLRRT